jgi:signal transducing adaptor molecule
MASTTTPAPAATTSNSAMAENGNIVIRVRALHTFKPTEAGGLAFEKGDIIIKAVDRGYKDWWRSRLKGRNYVVRFMSLIEHLNLSY